MFWLMLLKFRARHFGKWTYTYQSWDINFVGYLKQKQHQFVLCGCLLYVGYIVTNWADYRIVWPVCSSHYYHSLNGIFRACIILTTLKSCTWKSLKYSKLPLCSLSAVCNYGSYIQQKGSTLVSLHLFITLIWVFYNCQFTYFLWQHCNLGVPIGMRSSATLERPCVYQLTVLYLRSIALSLCPNPW